MAAKKIHKHKNNFFIDTFSRKEAAIDLREYLPVDIRASIAWNSIQTESAHFVDATLLDKESDMLYSVKLNHGNAFVYVLLEHQSCEDKWMKFRLLGYMVRIWEKFRKENPDSESLPVIIPLLLYQGQEAWERSLSMDALFSLSDAAKNLFSKYLPNFESELISLPSISEGAIKGDAYIQVAFKLMKAIRTGNMVATIEQIEGLLELICDEKGDVEFVLSCFVYALQAEEVDKDEVDAIFRVIRNTNLREKAMTIADQLEERGIERGIERGALIGRIQGYQELLNQKITDREELRLRADESLEQFHNQLKIQLQNKLQ